MSNYTRVSERRSWRRLLGPCCPGSCRRPSPPRGPGCGTLRMRGTCCPRTPPARADSRMWGLRSQELNRERAWERKGMKESELERERAWKRAWLGRESLRKRPWERELERDMRCDETHHHHSDPLLTWLSDPGLRLAVGPQPNVHQRADLLHGRQQVIEDKIPEILRVRVTCFVSSWLNDYLESGQRHS